MTMTLLPAPAPAGAGPTDTDDPFDHAYCCDPDTALCGADISDNEYGEEQDNPCPLCELIEARGVLCGEGCTR